MDSRTFSQSNNALLTAPNVNTDKARGGEVVTGRDGEGIVEADSTTLITNARLAYAEHDKAQQTWSILCQDGRVVRVLPTDADSNVRAVVIDAQGGLVLPS